MICFRIIIRNLPSTDTQRNFFQRNEYSKNISTQNATIVSSSGKPIILRGITSEVFRWDTKQQNSNKEVITKRLEMVKPWGINALQLYINPELFETDSQNESAIMKQLTDVINWAKHNSIYVVLIPVNEITWKHDLPVRDAESIATRDSMPQFLELLARRFASETVIFGLETEPKFIDSESQIEERIKSIRRFSDNPIIVSTLNFNGALNIIESIPRLKEQNIILDFHPYLAMNIADYQKQQLEIDKIKKLRERSEFKKYPFMIGEYGGFWKNDFNTAQDLQIFTDIACWAENHNYGQFIYSLDNEQFPLFDIQGNLTSRGAIAKEIIGSNRLEYCRTHAVSNFR